MTAEYKPGCMALIIMHVITLAGCAGNYAGPDADPESGAMGLGRVLDQGELAALEQGDGAEMMDHTRHMMDHMDDTGTVEEATITLAVPQTSAQGLFKAAVSSELSPIPLNSIHSWTLHLKTAAGQPVNEAQIKVEGGMPAHGHGLPTAPEIRRAQSDGDYLVEGMMFHMAGRWQISFEISVEGRKDSVIFNFALQ
jgi:hypothetical protein